MILAMVLIIWPAPGQPVRSDRVSRSVESPSTGAPRAGHFVPDTWVERLPGDSLRSNDLLGHRAKAILEEEEEESGDTKVFGMGVRSCTVADPDPLQSRSLRSYEPSLLAGPPARLLPLRC